MTEYILHIIVMLNIYILLVLSANLPIGMANLLTMCQSAFYGIGAYIGAFLLIGFELPFMAVSLVVMLLTGISSCVISFASVRLKEDYFFLATLGLQMIIYTILYNWTSVTHGPYGITEIPGIKLLGIWDITGNVRAYFLLTTLLTVMVILFFHRIRKSPYGRILRSIRYDELSVKALGRDTVHIKAWAFFISAMLSGLAGLIYASYLNYIDPTSFTLDESIFIISALFIGGTGNVKGSVFGAMFVIFLPELLSIAGMQDTVAANVRQIIYGLSLVVVMLFRPQGICGENILK